MNPVGPEEPKIYWRRRAVVGGALLLVLLLLFLVFSSCGSGEETTEPVASDQPTATPSPDPSETSAASAGSCLDEDIKVTVEPDSATYPAGTTPEITLAIQNIGSEACSRDIGADANSIEISSGGVRVWSSDDCDDVGGEDVQELDSQAVASVTIPWPRTISGKGCPVPPDEQPAAQPGAYDAIGKNLDVKSSKAAFTLE
jgi:hypothetical protein